MPTEEEYIVVIYDLLRNCKDISLLDFIFKLLKKSV